MANEVKKDVKNEVSEVATVKVDKLMDMSRKEVADSYYNGVYRTTIESLTSRLAKAEKELAENEKKVLIEIKHKTDDNNQAISWFGFNNDYNTNKKTSNERVNRFYMNVGDLLLKAKSEAEEAVKEHLLDLKDQLSKKDINIVNLKSEIEKLKNEIDLRQKEYQRELDNESRRTRRRFGAMIDGLYEEIAEKEDEIEKLKNGIIKEQERAKENEKMMALKERIAELEAELKEFKKTNPFKLLWYFITDSTVRVRYKELRNRKQEALRQLFNVW